MTPRLMGTRKAAEEAADRAIREGRLVQPNRESYIRGWLCLNRTVVKKTKGKKR